MGKSKKKKGLRSRKPCIRRRLTRKNKKIMLGGGWSRGFDGKPMWVPDELDDGTSYSGRGNSYRELGRNLYPNNEQVQTKNAINRTLARLQEEEKENRPSFYPYSSLKEKQTAEANEKKAAMSRIEQMKLLALKTEEARRLRNGSSPPPSYKSTVMADAEQRRQKQIELILSKTKGEDKKAEDKKAARRKMFKNMSIDEIHDWIRNREKEKRSNQNMFYDANEELEEGDNDEFFDAREFGGGLKRRIVKSRRLGKKRLTLKRRLQNKKASLK